MGFFYLGDDANTYLAKMRQGWEGAWSWDNRYTTESSPTVYLFMFWIVLGHLAALFNLPLIVVFHLARVAAAFALMAAIWAFVNHFIADRSARLLRILLLRDRPGHGLRDPGAGPPGDLRQHDGHARLAHAGADRVLFGAGPAALRVVGGLRRRRRRPHA